MRNNFFYWRKVHFLFFFFFFLASDVYTDLIVEEKTLQKNVPFDAVPIVASFINDIEQAKAIKVNAESSLKQIFQQITVGLVQLIPKINNIALKQIFLDALTDVKSLDQEFTDGEGTFALVENQFSTLAKALSKYFSQ